MADLTPDLQVCLSWGLIAENFHSLQSLFVSCFHVILGLPGPRFPSTCMSKAFLTAPLERSTCPYHHSLLSFRMRSRSPMPSRTSSSLDLVVTMSCGLTLQICLIIALSFRCRRWRFGFVNGQVSLHGALRPAHKSCTHGHVFWTRGKRIIWVPFLFRPFQGQHWTNYVIYIVYCEHTVSFEAVGRFLSCIAGTRWDKN